MTRIGYRYRFDEDIDLEDVEETLELALVATTGLFGGCRTQMDAAWAADESINTIVVDAGTLVGMTVGLIFTAFLRVELPAEAFSIEQVEVTFGPACMEVGR